MYFSASFIVGGLATYWIRNYSATGFSLSAAAIALVAIAGVVFVASAIAYVMERRPKETSAQAIERQIIEHRNKAA
jgi:hypothetical protein